MQAWTPHPAQSWPPADHAHIWDTTALYEAWWVGNPATLASRMARTSLIPPNHPSQYRGGLIGAGARFFWGRPRNDADNQPSRGDLHVPLASDLARTSADLLYSDPPTITVTPGQEVLDEIIENGLFEALMAGAELSAATGGRYHRVTIDPAIDNGRPFITTHSVDEVIPTFTWGRLTAATIITTITDDTHAHTVWRHLEQHWLDTAGNGHITHSLYEGTNSTLGHLVPLTDRPETAHISVTSQGEWAGPITPGLAVVYVPNITPSRAWRRDPVGRYLGRPDVDGLISLMDALDEAWSSWMRDLRLGKARILAARTALDTSDDNGPVFDLDREVFTALDVLDRGDDLPIKPIQFDIRVSEHEATVRALTEAIISHAGYSLGSFQESQDADVTATEVKAREKRTLTTRGRKIAHETRAVKALIAKALSWAGYGASTDVTVTFPEAISENPLDQASSITALTAASVMSHKIAVGLLHPDWADPDIERELAQISQEHADNAILTDPTAWHPAMTPPQPDQADSQTEN